MDIDRLKGAWRSYTAGLKERGAKGTGELRDILSRKSQQSLQRLRKNFLIEAGINVAAIPVVLIIVLSQFGQVGDHRYYLSAFLAFLLVGFLLFLYRSYMRIFRYEQLELSLEKKLWNQIIRLQSFMRNYAVIGYVLYFLAFVVSLLISAYNNLLDEWPRLSIGLGIGIVVFFLLVRPLTRYYLKRLYGRHLDSLRRYLEELNESL
jgi:MFS family permease